MFILVQLDTESNEKTIVDSSFSYGKFMNTLKTLNNIEIKKQSNLRYYVSWQSETDSTVPTIQ